MALAIGGEVRFLVGFTGTNPDRFSLLCGESFGPIWSHAVTCFEKISSFFYRALWYPVLQETDRNGCVVGGMSGAIVKRDTL